MSTVQELVSTRTEKIEKNRRADEENKRLIYMYRETGDKQHREELFKKNGKLAHHISGKFLNTNVAYDDMVSLALYGMLKAFNTFDLDKDIRFATYATRCMENEILMEVRKQKKHRTTSHLDMAIGSDKNGNELTLADIAVSDSSADIDRSDDRTAIMALVQELQKELTPVEQKVFENMLQADERVEQKAVAEELNMSQSYISRLEKSVRAKAVQVAERIGIGHLLKFNTTYDTSKRNAPPSEVREIKLAPVTIYNKKELEEMAVGRNELKGMSMKEKVEYMMAHYPLMAIEDIAKEVGGSKGTIYTYMSTIRNEQRTKQKEEKEARRNDNAESAMVSFETRLEVEEQRTAPNPPPMAPPVPKYPEPMAPPVPPEMSPAPPVPDEQTATPHPLWEFEDVDISTYTSEAPKKRVAPPAKLVLDFDGLDIEQIVHFMKPYVEADGSYKVSITIEKVFPHKQD